MPFNLRQRNFLKELDFTCAEWRYLVDLAGELKRAKYAGMECRRLAGKNIALVFERTSTGTRCAFEIAAQDQGAQVSYLDPVSSKLGYRESLEDSARILGRFYDGIQYLGSKQAHADMLARYSGVPVWNGLTSSWHPTQSLGDTLTMREHSPKRDSEIGFAFCGDTGSHIGNSLLVVGAMMGMDVRMVGPKQCWNDDEVTKEARRIAELTGARIAHTEDIAEGVHAVDFLYTTGWLSGYEPENVWSERIALLHDYQVTMDVVRATSNHEVRFMHCLPAFRDRRTLFGERIFEYTGMDALEVTTEVFESPHSIVFDQAENRLHAIKAVMVATLGF